MDDTTRWSFSAGDSDSSAPIIVDSETSLNSKPTFPTLPTELRLQIWSLTVPPPRIIRIALPLGRKPADYYAYSLSPPLSPFIPAILHINHESRTVGLSIFRLGFSTSTLNHCPSKSHKRYWTYWNPRIDTLYLPSWNPPTRHDPRQDHDFPAQSFDPVYPEVPNDTFFASTLHHTLLSLVQHLALPWDFRTATSLALRPISADDPSLLDSSTEGAWLPCWLKGFTSLKSVTFLIDDLPQAYRAGEIALEEPEMKTMETYSECFRSRRRRGAMPFLALPSDIERVVLWRLEEEWTKEGKGKKRMEVPGVKLMVVRKERLQREDFLLRQPFPIRAARKTPLTSGLWV
jgi:hypothetical protein